MRVPISGLSARSRRGLAAGALAVAVAVAVVVPAVALMTPRAHAASSHSVPAGNPVSVDPAVAAPAAAPALAPEVVPGPVHLPFLGTGNPKGAPAPVARPGSYISVPAVGLQVAVADYTDCSGDTPMTRVTAVRFTCAPAAVTDFVGHNPGVFTPLTRTHAGDRVYYQHDGLTDAWTISEIHRVSPQDAATYSQDGSYAHAVLATCAEPDSSAYWVFIALPDGATGRPAGTQQASTGPAPQSSPPRPQSQPSPSPSPTPAGTTLPGGITIPPPPH